MSNADRFDADDRCGTVLNVAHAKHCPECNAELVQWSDGPRASESGVMCGRCGGAWTWLAWFAMRHLVRKLSRTMPRPTPPVRRDVADRWGGAYPPPVV